MKIVTFKDNTIRTFDDGITIQNNNNPIVDEYTVSDDTIIPKLRSDIKMNKFKKKDLVNLEKKSGKVVKIT